MVFWFYRTLKFVFKCPKVFPNFYQMPFSCPCLRSLLLKMWSTDQQHQYHLRIMAWEPLLQILSPLTFSRTVKDMPSVIPSFSYIIWIFLSIISFLLQYMQSQTVLDPNSSPAAASFLGSPFHQSFSHRLSRCTALPWSDPEHSLATSICLLLPSLPWNWPYPSQHPDLGWGIQRSFVSYHLIRPLSSTGPHQPHSP